MAPDEVFAFLISDATWGSNEAAPPEKSGKENGSGFGDGGQGGRGGIG